METPLPFQLSEVAKKAFANFAEKNDGYNGVFFGLPFTKYL